MRARPPRRARVEPDLQRADPVADVVGRVDVRVGPQDREIGIGQDRAVEVPGLDPVPAHEPHEARHLADGGGRVAAARRPVIGAAPVAALVKGLVRLGSRVPGLRLEITTANGAPAIVVRDTDRLDTVIVVEVVDDAISHLYAVRNPDKLWAAPRG